MASYGKFQSKIAKHNSDTRVATDPELTQQVDTFGAKDGDFILDNLETLAELISYWRWYPDLFLDMLTPETGGIKLHTDQRVYLRTISRFYSTYGILPRGWGKCVTGDSLIFTDQGIKEMGEFFDYDQDGNEKWKELKINVLNRNGDLEYSSMGLYNGKQKTKKIKTNEGYEIEGTLNHPILVMGEDGTIDFKRLEDISVGEFAVISRNNSVWGNNTSLVYDLADWVYSVSKQKSSPLNIRELPKTLDKDIALVFGYLIGDGCLTKNDRVGFTNKDPEILDNIFRIFADKFNTSWKKVKATGIDFYFNDVYLRKYLDINGLKQTDAFGKEIPRCIMESTEENMAYFLRGLFDTDGTAEKHRISLCTVSKKMAKQVQIALLNFGIISSLTYRTSKKGFFHYLVQIYGENISLFNRKIGFGCTYKKKQAESTEKIIRNTNKNIIPNQKNKVTNMYHEIKKYNTYLNDKVYHVISGNNELTYAKLHEILGLNNIKESSQYSHFSDLEKQNYFFSKITGIEDGENHVYDFSIPETHSFVSNGFVSHNTHGEVLISVVLCILYPGINIAMTAQTKENAASILSSKIKTEILKQFPLIENEIVKKSFSKSEAEIIFANGSSLDILANAQTSKGQRRTRINVEESALLNKELFEDALQPIVEIARYTCGQLSVVDPEEMNQQINFFTTAGWRGSDEFERNLAYVDLMADCNGEFVIGSDWHLACWYGRGSTKPQIMKKKSQMSPVAFDQNYGSKWTGNISGCLVDIKKLLATRTLENYEAEAEKGYDYVISVDVARSEKTSNNQSSIAVLKIIRSNNRIINVDLVNLSTMSNALNFTKQAIEVKRMWHKFNNHGRVVACTVDSNGLGRGLLEELMKEHVDPITRLLYPCFNTINTEDAPETTNSIKIMYAIVAQSIQSDILTTFIDMVDSGRLRLLIKKDNSDYDIKTDIEEQVVYINTDFLIEEIANLKLKLGNGTGKLAIEQIVRRIDKDRFSALVYGLWYIKSFESVVKTNNFDWGEYMFF